MYTVHDHARSYRATGHQQLAINNTIGLVLYRPLSVNFSLLRKHILGIPQKCHYDFRTSLGFVRLHKLQPLFKTSTYHEWLTHLKKALFIIASSEFIILYTALLLTC